MLEFSINLLGPPAQKNLPDVLRYEPGFSVDLLADLALPIGEYDSSQALNLGRLPGLVVPARRGLPVLTADVGGRTRPATGFPTWRVIQAVELATEDLERRLPHRHEPAAYNHDATSS
jgi:hypothetical protein